jgi:hypothetical protein
MKPTGPNSFFDDSPSSGKGGGSRVSGRSTKPAAVRATLSPRVYGWQLEVSPMRAFDALRVWPKLTPGQDSASLLFDVTLDPGAGPARAPGCAGDDNLRFSLGSLADRFAIPSLERFDEDQLVMEPMRLRELVGMIEQAHLRTVCVDGPIEPRDAAAMRRAIAAGLSPLQAEFRATAAIEVTADRTVTFQSREKTPALRLIAESFRLFIGGVCLRERPIDEIAPPEFWQVERLIDVSGTISMRLIETDVFSTFIDVGVSSETEPFTKPANLSLIYDLPSNTWHDEA